MKKTIRLLAAALLGASLIASAQANARSYLVMAQGNNVPPGLAKEIKAAGGTITKVISQVGIVVVESENPDFATSISGVQAVMPNLTVNWLPDDLQVEMADDAANPPNSGDDDFFFDLQWGHDVVNAPEAWDAGQRGAGVRVAVLDSGIDHDNPDLAPNLNTELSRSFVPGEDFFVRPGRFFNHGSHVAGTIGAADNGFGTIGVAPDVELVAVKVLSEFTGSGEFSGVIEGIVYAADIDADIINMSLGATLPRHGDPQGEEPYNGADVAALATAISRAVTYAYQSGTVVFVSEGNSAINKDRPGEGYNGDLITLPADATNAVSISATAPLGWVSQNFDGNFNGLAYYSNYGLSAVEFGAPGGTLAYPGNEACLVAGLVRPCWVFDLVFSNSSEAWFWAQGTSMAAPHAAGVAAIIIGENGGDMHPAAVQIDPGM